MKSQTSENQTKTKQHEFNYQEAKSAKLMDMGAYRLLCALVPGTEFEIMGKPLKCISAEPLLRMTIEYNGVRIGLKHAFGNWYTGLNAKFANARKMPKHMRAYNTLLRDIEGLMILDSINRNNPLHQPFEVVN